MRQALNNLQSTYAGFGIITTENVFKVCDQPHPLVVQTMLKACDKGDVVIALEKLEGLWNEGYAAVDIVTTIFRVTKAFDQYVFFLAVHLNRLHRYNLTMMCPCDNFLVSQAR